MVFACLDGSGLRIPTIDTNKSPLIPRICTVLQFFFHIQNISNLARNTEVVKTAQKYVHNRQSAVSFSLHDTSKLRKVLKIPTNLPSFIASHWKVFDHQTKAICTSLVQEAFGQILSLG